AVSPGRLPEVMRSMLEMAPSFLLPDRRERSYPRAVRTRPQKYAVRKMPVRLN
ncbi:IS4 family transposase, partial [Vreelandella lionensis]